MLNKKFCEELASLLSFRHINKYVAVMLLREKGDVAVLFPRTEDKYHCDYSIVIFEHDNSDFEFLKAFQPKSCHHVRPIVPSEMVLSLPRRGLQPRRENVSVSATPVTV